MRRLHAWPGDLEHRGDRDRRNARRRRERLRARELVPRDARRFLRIAQTEFHPNGAVELRRHERAGEYPVDPGGYGGASRARAVHHREDLRSGTCRLQIGQRHRLRADPDDHQVRPQLEDGLRVGGGVDLDHVRLRQVQAQEEGEVRVGLDEHDPRTACRLHKADGCTLLAFEPVRNDAHWEQLLAGKAPLVSVVYVGITRATLTRNGPRHNRAFHLGR